jgi:hypothetical protein
MSDPPRPVLAVEKEGLSVEEVAAVARKVGHLFAILPRPTPEALENRADELYAEFDAWLKMLEYKGHRALASQIDTEVSEEMRKRIKFTKQ